MLIRSGGQQPFPVNSPSVRENSLVNTVVGTFVAQDSDANAKLTFSLDSSAGGRFKVTAVAHCYSVTAVPVCEETIVAFTLSQLGSFHSVTCASYVDPLNDMELCSHALRTMLAKIDFHIFIHFPVTSPLKGREMIRNGVRMVFRPLFLLLSHQ